MSFIALYVEGAQPAIARQADRPNAGDGEGQNVMKSDPPKDVLEQLVSMQKEMQKRMNTIVSAPVNKEGKGLETSLGRSSEKFVKAETDALWARFQGENVKHKKLAPIDFTITNEQ